MIKANVPMMKLASVAGLDRDTFAAFVLSATPPPSPRVTFGSRGDGFDWLALGRYMDEVNTQAHAFDAWVGEVATAKPSGSDRLSGGFFSLWNSFMNATPPHRDSRGRHYGWRAYYRSRRGLLVPDVLSNWIFDDSPLWDQTEAYEAELIRLYDMAVAEGGSPPGKRPQPKYQPPPPEETIEGQVRTALTWVGIVGLIAAVGYVLHGLPLQKGSVLPSPGS